MSELIDRIKNHAVWEELRALGPAIDGALARDHADTAVVDGLERLRAVLAFCNQRLTSVDPFLLEPRPLAAIQKTISAMRPEVEGYVADGNAAHIVTANAHADNLLAALAAVFAPQVTEDLTSISEAAGSYRTTLEKYLKAAQELSKQLTAESNKAKSNLQQLSNDITAEKQKLSAVITEQQTTFSAAQDKRAQEFTAAQTERQEKSTNATAEFQAQFTAGQTERLEKYNALIANHTKLLTEQDALTKTKLAESLKQSDENLAELKAKYEQLAKAKLDEIDTHKTKVEKLVGVIGNLAVTSGYQITANRALLALYVWQALTVISLGALIYVAYLIAFKQPVSETAFYQGMATRVFLSIAVGIFAAYAARQASNSWQIERQNRKLALELEALGPYIAPLPEDLQHKFRLQVGDRSFGVADGNLEKLAERSPVSLVDLFKTKEFKEILIEAVKAAR